MKSSAPTRTELPFPVTVASALHFTEREAWKSAGNGWQPLHGSFRGVGYSFEWHDFTPKSDFDWAATFHPGSLELCLNLTGEGFVKSKTTRAEFEPNTVGFYCRTMENLQACRTAGQRHQFLTVEYAGSFLHQHLAGTHSTLHPLARSVMEKSSPAVGASIPTKLSSATRQIVESLRHPPVYASAQPIWYQCKAVELALTFLFQLPEGDEFFCTRQQRLAQDRVEHVIDLLKHDLSTPPSLEELGRKIGCSHFYLSRIFSAHTGQTITQYLRQLRLEKAAELLRSGDYNVTEAALEVGYSSLSHFSQAFREVFGCCPGLYPVRKTGVMADEVPVPPVMRG